MAKPKLINLQGWLLLSDAAKYLSGIFEEDVNEADVLRLGLDGHLKLSVNFVNHAVVKCGKFVTWDETEWFYIADLDQLLGYEAASNVPTADKYLAAPPKLKALLDRIPADELARQYPIMRSKRIDEHRFVNLSETVVNIDGVWDLPMIGAEALDIQNKYQRLTGGPAITLQYLDGSFVEGRNGEVFQLQEDYDDTNHGEVGTRASLKGIQEFIGKEGVSADEAKSLLAWYQERRASFLEKRKTQPVTARYHPADLPEDAVIVVRLEALQDFEQSLNGNINGKATDPKVAPRGLSKSEMLAQDWPLRGGFNKDSLSRAMSDLKNAKWLARAMVMRGKSGEGGSALWNPALFGGCLIDRRYATKSAIERHIATYYAEWLDEWMGLSEFF